MLIRARFSVSTTPTINITPAFATLHDISIGAFALEPFTPADIHRCGALLRTYADLNLGLADAAVMATAERLGIRGIFTVDEREFRAVRSSNGSAFTLLPADA